MFVFDCGPLNRNPAVAMAFLQWLCDSGFCVLGFALFLQLHHSKELADMFFGNIESIFGKVTIIGMESFMAAIDKLTTCKATQEKMKARRMNPMGLVSLKKMLKEQYNLDKSASISSDFRFTAKDYHFFTAVRSKTEAMVLLDKMPRLPVYEGDSAFK